MPPYESHTVMRKVSALQRDYLAEIYQACHIERLNGERWISSGDLAQRMNISQSTVNRVVERLRERHLIEHHRYVGVQLTPQGRRIAHHILRDQAIIESFLVVVMGFAWQDVYMEARNIRQGVNDLILQRMWGLAGQPTHSPFGEPIGGEQHKDEALLNDAHPKRDYRIARILTRQKDRLDYLAALGLMPGVLLHLAHKAPFDGPLQIQLGREYRVLGHQLAHKITVVPHG